MKEKSDEEKIKKQIAYDRKEFKDRLLPQQDSIANQTKFGCKSSGFKEIGIDLNKQSKG